MKDYEREKLNKEIDRLKKNLTKRDQELKKLQVSNLCFESLFDGISEEILMLDQDMRIVDVNKAFLKRYGIKKKDALGKACYEIKDQACIRRESKNEICPVERAEKSRKKVEVIHSYLNEKGGLKELLIILYPIQSGNRKKKYFIEITRDMTEHRNLISKIKSSEKKFRAILDTASDAIVSIDDNHKIILFNNAAQKIFGYSSQEAIGKDLNMLFPQQYGDHRRYLQRFLKKKTIELNETKRSLTALRRHGEEFPIELTLSFLEMEGKVTTTAIIKDMTKRRQMESRLLQSTRLAAVGQAVAHVAHEIKNPLMIIGGFTSQIRAGMKEERNGRKLEMVMEEVKRMEKLVAHLGDFTEEYRLVKRSADINAVLRDVIKIMNGVYSRENIYFFKDFLSDNINEIDCDPDKLKQVFINVISNGIEAMPSGGTITVSTEKIEGGIEIRINDEGVGIPEGDIQYIFQPFYTTREKGFGLGLSISYKLIEAHEGDIWAVSQAGKGTTFFIQLPAS